MAKKSARTANGQTLIDGTHDDVPDIVMDKAVAYRRKLKERQKIQKAEDTLRDETLDLMREHAIERVSLDVKEDLVRVMSEPKEKLQIKKRDETA